MTMKTVSPKTPALPYTPAPILLPPRPPPPAIAVAAHPSIATTAVAAQPAPARDYLLPATTTITTTSATRKDESEKELYMEVLTLHRANLLLEKEKLVLEIGA